MPNALYGLIFVRYVHNGAGSEDVIAEIVEKSKMNQGKRNDLTSGSVEPKVNPYTNTGEEIGKF